MSFGWLRPLGLSQPKDILDEATCINQHKAICPILMTIILYSTQEFTKFIDTLQTYELMEVPVRG